MTILLKNIRYGVRSLLKRLAFTAVVLLTLAVGIGANAAIVSVVNAVLLKSLPYPHPEHIVYVFGSRVSDPKVESSLSPHNFTDLRGRNQSFDAYCTAGWIGPESVAGKAPCVRPCERKFGTAALNTSVITNAARPFEKVAILVKH